MNQAYISRTFVCLHLVYVTCLHCLNFFLAYREYLATDHDCTEGPDLNPYDVRLCRHWYRCEKPQPGDGANPSTHLVIDNLNFSNVVDDTGDVVLSFKRTTAFYDSIRLKAEVRKFDAIRMTFLVPACPDHYPYAVVHFPTVEKAKAAFDRLQGRCLGSTGRHLRTTFISPYDYTYGGRNSECLTASIKPQITPPSTEELARPSPVRKTVVTPRRRPRDESPKPSPPRFRRAKNGMRVRIPDDTVGHFSERTL
jgi:hypothetical protein